MWPVTLQEREITLRAIRRRDVRVLNQLIQDNLGWLEPWKASSPGLPPLNDMGRFRRWASGPARKGLILPLLIAVDGRIAGQLTVGMIQWGALRSAPLGYWIAEEYAGKGIMPRAVKLASNYCFREMDLHRLEIHTCLDNRASQRVAEKCGFENEGIRREYIFVNGAWRDHYCYALIQPKSTDFTSDTH